MRCPQAPATRLTLIERLQQTPFDPAAWADFVGGYGPAILGWCRQWGLQEADAHDVAQAVLARLLRRMQTFEYDPAKSFRAWLRKIVRNALADFQAEHGRAGEGSGDDDVLDCLNNVEAREDLLARLDRLFDREVAAEAMRRVQARVDPRTWEAFDRTALKDQPAPEVAAALGMRVSAVYQAKHRVFEMLREEVSRLEGTDGCDAGAVCG